MKPLYALADAYQAALEAAYDNAADGDGTIPSELVAALETADQDFANKVEHCCRMLADMKARAGACDHEAKRLSAQAKAVTRQYDWLRGYVKEQMERLGKTELRAGLWSVRIQNSQPSVAILDESQIPDSFFRTERVLEKSSIAAILKEGGEVPGAELRAGTHLVVK